MTNQSLLSSDEVNAILAGNCKDKSPTVNSFTIKSFGGAVTGYLGDHLCLLVNVTENGVDNEKKYFIKSAQASPGTSQYEFTVKTGIFEREITLYKHIFTEISKMIEAKTKNRDLMWAPKFLYSKGKSLLVLEDICVRGYRVATDRKPLDKEHLLVALSTIANMHASMFWYEQKILEKTGGKHLTDVFPILKKESIFLTDDPSNPFSAWFTKIIKAFESLVDFLDYNEKELKIIRKKLTATLIELAKLIKPSKTFRNVLTHGDLWSNNMMFKYEKDKPVFAVLVDYQLSRYAPPAQDAMHFIYLVTDKEEREKLMEELKEYYYRQLEMHLTKYGLDINNLVPRHEFVESCQYYTKSAMIHTLTCLSYTLTPEFVTNDAWTCEQRYRDFIMDKREHYMRESFKDDIYKKRLSEKLNEIIDNLILK